MSKLTDGRLQRNKYVYDNFIKPLKVRSILDVGCSANYMAMLHKGNVCGVDIDGRPDITIDLEKPHALRSIIGTFDCVTAIDSLEHFENMHQIIKDMIRIAERYIVFTFPNELRLNIYLKRLLKPNERENGFFPKNRHKWFLAYSQCREFALYLSYKYELDLIRFEPMLGKYSGAIHKIIKGKLPNLMPLGCVIVLKKKR